MATIIARRRKDGTRSYRASTCTMRGNPVLHRAARTFHDKTTAQQWTRALRGVEWLIDDADFAAYKAHKQSVKSIKDQIRAMRRREADFASPAVLQTAVHFGGLVRQARLARSWTQQGLAERARISLATLKRMEGGAVEVSLGGWLAVFESLGLLSLFGALRDPASAALLDTTKARRARPGQRDDLDF